MKFFLKFVTIRLLYIYMREEIVMHRSIGKILPADGYRTKKNFVLSHDEYEAIYQLYQPIIGLDAVSLYVTLFHQIAFHTQHSHHYLMQMLNLPLDRIYDARLKCEAIGLMDTYRTEDEQMTCYDFELHQPLTPIKFVHDDLLSQMLYHQIGKSKFHSLKEQILNNQGIELTGDVITANFIDVFSNREAYHDKEANVTESEIDLPDSRIEMETVLDFDWLRDQMKTRMLPIEAIFTRDNMQLINHMAVLYSLSTTEVEKILQWSIDSDHRLDREAFKEACLDAVDIKPSKKQVITQRDRLKQSSNESDVKKSKRERYIEQMKTISPKDLLEDLSNSRTASTQDLKMIAGIMDQHNLSGGVMNVLIHYVMIKTDMKLTKAYLEKIASHWSRKQVKTVEAAMRLAKEEHEKYQEWDKGKKRSYQKPGSKREVVPEWFKKQKETQAKKQTTQASPKTAEDVSASDDVDQLLKAYKENKQR